LKENSESRVAIQLIHAHICPKCDRASRREDPDGVPDAAGVFHCSQCGHEGPLNEAIIEETDARFRH
jgi:ribosomal protein L37AE/L43A